MTGIGGGLTHVGNAHAPQPICSNRDTIIPSAHARRPATRVLLRTRPSPLTWDQARLLRGARPVGPPPRPSAELVTAQRVANNTDVIMVAGQKIALGRIHARRIVTVHVAADTITIDLASDDTRVVRRTTTQPVRSIKAQQPRKVFLGHLESMSWDKSVKYQVGLDKR